MNNGRITVLFICTGNSARSQMAEALLRTMGGDRFVVMSGGTEIQSRVNEFALRVLEERGIDTTGLRPKRVDSVYGQHFNIVVTVCDLAKETCPVFPSADEMLHWSIEDPAAYNGTYFDILTKFREVCDEIERRIREEIISRREGEH